MWKGRILFVAIAGMAAVFAIGRFTRTAEPAYHGHSLSKWVAILGEGSHREEAVQRAAEAVNSIGTNATPYLLAWIQFEPKPGPFQSRANPYNPNWQQLSLRDRVLYDYFRSRHQRAAEEAGEAFRVLGARAAPAIPELARLMNGRAGSITSIVLLRQACGGRKNRRASPRRGIWVPVGPIAISRRLPQPVSRGDSACS
jgi:hypothetical protein